MMWCLTSQQQLRACGGGASDRLEEPGNELGKPGYKASGLSTTSLDTDQNTHLGTALYKL